MGIGATRLPTVLRKEDNTIPSQSTCRTERRHRRSTALTVWGIRSACSWCSCRQVGTCAGPCQLIDWVPRAGTAAREVSRRANCSDFRGFGTKRGLDEAPSRAYRWFI